MRDVTCDRFADDPVSEQIGARGFHYEGSTTSAPRVSRRTVGLARGGLAKSRAKTVRGKRKAIVRGGAKLVGGTRLERRAPRKKLTASQIRARTIARAERRGAGTAGNRRRTQQRIAAARRQGAVGSRRLGP